LAKISIKNGELDDAEDYIEAAVRLNPKDSETQFFYGKIMGLQAKASNIFRKMGYAKKLHKGFKAAVEISPNNIEYRRSLITFHLIAPSIIGGDKSEALKQAFAIEKLDGLAGSCALLQVYAQLEKYEELDSVFNDAVNRYPHEPELFYHRGLIFQKDEKYQDALTNFNKAAVMTTTSIKQHQAKYNALYQVGRTSILSKSHYDEGEKALIQYIAEVKLTPSMISMRWAQYRLANIWEAKGDEISAIKLYKEVIKEAMDSELKKKGKNRLKNLS